MSDSPYRVTDERTVYSYVCLREGACAALAQAKDSEKHRFHNCMSVIIFSAFCLEAYLNHLGQDRFEYWDDDIKKNLTVENKLKIIAHDLGLTLDFSRRPFQSFRTTFKFRNLVAHAQTDKKTHQGDHALREGQDPSTMIQEPQTWWEKQCSLQSAQRLLEDAERIISLLHKETGSKTDPFRILSSTLGTGERR